jgi:NADPH-dependent ferric siderophore reductase
MEHFMTETSSARPNPVRRVRHELRRRTLKVLRTEWLTQSYLAITFGTPELEGFTSLGFDDHIKLLFQTGGDSPAMRDYTPRSFDPLTRELTIEFAIHQPAGPATAWALGAKPGDTLDIGGPRGSFILDDVFDGYLFIADEAGVPALRRRLEELREGVPVHAILLQTEPGAPIPLPERAGLHAVALPATPDAVAAHLSRAPKPEGEVYAWVAAEASLARDLRALLVEDLGYDRRWVKAASYWRRGEIGVHEVIERGEGDAQPA